MKITTDTNVLVSSIFWPGDSFRIIEKVENGEIELVLSEEIIEELVNVLNYEEIQNKIKNKNLEIRKTIEEIVAISTIVEPKKKLKVIKEDPEDNKILECALEGKVNCIITKDNHLLKLKEYESIKILTPEDFLNEL